MSKLDGRVRDSRGRLEAGRHSYEWLLQYPQVKDWIGMYPNLHTRVSYLRGLEAVVKVTGKKPPELLALPSEEARRTILSALRGWIQEGKVRAAARTQIIMRTFYEANDRELPFKRGDRVKDVVKKIGVQYIPGKEDVYRMVDALGGELRNKAIILCLFQSGARVGGLCRWMFSLVKDQLYPEVKVPVMLQITNQIDAKLSGYGLGYYYTFLHREAAEALRA